MNIIALPIIAMTAGAAIAIQAGLNSQLGVLLKNPLIATSIAFLGSFLLVFFVLLTTTKHLPSLTLIKSIPPHLWLAGSILSAAGITTFYWSIPKMGAGPMMSCALTGQLLASMIASHYGWFQLPEIPITSTKILGIITLMLGIIMIGRPS